MAGSEKEVVITYETLFELLRLEKSRAELQKLSPTFLEDVQNYIGEKLAILNQEAPQTSLFASAEKDKTQREITNIVRILKDFYGRREKKIIDMALIKARTESEMINTGNMLKHERDFFDTVSNDIKLYRSASLLKLLNGEEIDKSMVGPQEAPEKTSPQPTEQPPHTPEEPSEPQQNPNIYKEEPASTAQQSTNTVPTVRFVSAVDEIVGPDLQIYGPFKAGDAAELPKELAQALINNKQAEPL